MPLDLQNQQQVPLQAASPPALDVAPYQINPIQMRLSCLSKTWNHPALHAIEWGETLRGLRRSSARIDLDRGGQRRAVHMKAHGGGGGHGVPVSVGSKSRS